MIWAVRKYWQRQLTMPGREDRRPGRSTLSRTVDGAILLKRFRLPKRGTTSKTSWSNATYYAALFENQPQSLKQRLGRIYP